MRGLKQHPHVHTRPEIEKRMTNPCLIVTQPGYADGCGVLLQPYTHKTGPLQCKVCLQGSRAAIVDRHRSIPWLEWHSKRKPSRLSQHVHACPVDTVYTSTTPTHWLQALCINTKQSQPAAPVNTNQRARKLPVAVYTAPMTASNCLGQYRWFWKPRLYCVH